MKARRGYQLMAIAAVALITAACGASSNEDSSDDGRFEGVELAGPQRKPDVVLTDTNGDQFDLRAETDGSITLLYFGYTNCPDICPVHLAQVQQVLENPDMPNDVKVVFVSVDPARDTPEVIRAWLDKFDSSYIGLTGSQANLDAAQRAANVSVAFPNPEDDGDTVGHAAQVIAYAPNGYAYSVYPFGVRQTQWIHDLPIIAEITDAP